MSGTSLKGSGKMIHWDVEFGGVCVLTNRHVLFNDEELDRSTFDVFYDYSHGDPEDKQKLFKRCRRGDGQGCLNMMSGLDVTLAIYFVKDDMKSHIKKKCCPETEDNERYIHETQLPIPNRGKSTVPTVCLISHPLRRTKHVSFGHLVDVNYSTLTVHHTAPSKPGSSGAPIMVFTNTDDLNLGDGFPYHVGTDPSSGHKEAKMMHSLQWLLETESSLVNFAKKASENVDFRPDQLAGAANACLEERYLAAFAPIFGAFLSHTEKCGLEGIDPALFKPCKTLLSAASAFSVIMNPCVGDLLQKLRQALPDFDWGSLSNPGEGSDLACLLTPKGPCFCRSIVKLMERGVKSGDSTLTESFLSPDTAAAKMASDSDVTWPWLNRRECDVSSVCAEEEECLMKKCLQHCEHHRAELAPFLLLIMMRKANVLISQIPPHFPQVSLTTQSDKNKKKKDIFNNQTIEALPRQTTSEKRPGGTGTFPCSAAQEESTSPSTRSQGDCAEFIGQILHLFAFALNSGVGVIVGLVNDTNGVLLKQEEGDESLNTLFSRFLARKEHDVQHLQQDHPDWKPPEEGDGSGGPCHCGRPAPRQIYLSTSHQACLLVGEKYDLMGSLETDMKARAKIFFHKLQEEALEKQPKNPGNFILTFLDNCRHFPQGRNSLTLLQASQETLLYNYRQLLRQVNKTVQTLYFALPVSVYGRPGNWPGNVTPPEVQRKAWRLIQDAIMESGFPPAVLVDLEEDAERRQRLIDVYVDMKQLKWQGRIQPHLFREALAFPKTFRHFCVFSEVLPFHDTTCYFAWSVSALVCPKVTFR